MVCVLNYIKASTELKRHPLGKASRRCVEAPHASRRVLTVRCTVRPYHATHGVIPHGGQPLGRPGAPPRPSCPHREQYVTPALALSTSCLSRRHCLAVYL